MLLVPLPLLLVEALSSSASMACTTSLCVWQFRDVGETEAWVTIAQARRALHKKIHTCISGGPGGSSRSMAIWTVSPWRVGAGVLMTAVGRRVGARVASLDGIGVGTSAAGAREGAIEGPVVVVVLLLLLEVVDVFCALLLVTGVGVAMPLADGAETGGLPLVPPLPVSPPPLVLPPLVLPPLLSVLWLSTVPLMPGAVDAWLGGCVEAVGARVGDCVMSLQSPEDMLPETVVV